MVSFQILDILQEVPGGVRSLCFPDRHFRAHDFEPTSSPPLSAGNAEELDDFIHMCTECLAGLILCQVGNWWRAKKEKEELDLDSSFESVGDTSSGAISSGSGAGNSSGDGLQLSESSEGREELVQLSDVEEV